MLDIARAKPGADAIRFEVGDAQSLPYEDASFDVVASNFGVIFAPDRDAVARELARVCRPNGRLGLTVWHRKPELEELWDRFGRTSSVDPYVWAGAPEQERLLGEAFELEQHERVWRLEGDDGEAVFEFMSRVAPPTKAFLAELDDETRAAVREALIEYWEGFRVGDRISEPRPYTLLVGRRR
jgi:SAM-dependent methyltransferase